MCVARCYLPITPPQKNRLAVARKIDAPDGRRIVTQASDGRSRANQVAPERSLRAKPGVGRRRAPVQVGPTQCLPRYTPIAAQRQSAPAPGGAYNCGVGHKCLRNSRAPRLPKWLMPAFLALQGRAGLTPAPQAVGQPPTARAFATVGKPAIETDLACPWRQVKSMPPAIDNDCYSIVINLGACP